MIRATLVGLVSVAAIGLLVNVANPGAPAAPSGSTREARHPLATSRTSSGAGAASYAETILHAFTGTNGDGNGPTGGLVADSLGNYYGATAGGGTAGLGTIYRLAAGTSTYAVFHNFSGVSGFELPAGDLAIDANSSLYGTMEQFSEGEVFKLTSAGTEGVLYTFSGSHARRI